MLGLQHRHIRSLIAPIGVALSLAACDQSAVDIAKQIDAAREGCTQEELTAGAEECVQMFEQYMEMGTKAINTYIGAVRAFDEALDRRPEVPFDTAGIGHAISPDFGGAEDSIAVDPDPRLDPFPDGGYGDGPQRWESEPSWRSGTAYPPPEPGVGEPGVGTAPREPYVAGPPRRTPDPGFDRTGPARRPAPTDPRDVREAPVAPRGVLLPPEQRLRRPWLDDEEPPPAYESPPAYEAPPTYDAPPTDPFANPEGDEWTDPGQALDPEAYPRSRRY